jgi:hypothetical protein
MQPLLSKMLPVRFDNCFRYFVVPRAPGALFEKCFATVQGTILTSPRFITSPFK